MINGVSWGGLAVFLVLLVVFGLMFAIGYTAEPPAPPTCVEQSR